MRRRDLSLTIALCVSLLTHGLGMFALVRQEVARLAASLHQPPIDPNALAVTLPPADVQPPPQPKPAPPPALPEPNLVELFGERGSTGDASNASKGDVLMQARAAPEEQASLTTNPGDPTRATPAGDDGGATPRPAKDRAADRAAAAAQVTPFGPPVDPDAPFGLPLAPAPEQMAPLPFRPKSNVIARVIPSSDASPTTQSAVTQADSPATRPVETAATKPVDRPIDVATVPSPVTDAATTRPVTVAVDTPRPTTAPIGQLPSTSQPVVVRPPMTAVASINDVAHPVDTVAPTPPGSPVPAASGDIGHKSESESDAFSKKPAVVYRDGKVVARDGRRVKTVKPKLTDAGYQRLMGMDEPTIILIAHIDEKGKVTGVDFERKSDFPEVDLPAMRALYDWEFEPSKDAAGHAKPDVMLVDFTWR